MKIEKLNSKEYNDFFNNNKYATFYQQESWGKLKEHNGWSYELIGAKENKKIVAAALLLYKKAPMGIKMCYSPRGFLIDYHDKKLVDSFVNALKAYLKEKKVSFIKIDPYISHLERDIDGQVVENGEDNTDVVKLLKSLGFIHYGYNQTLSTELQPRWMFTLDIGDKTEEELMMGMTKQTRKNVKKTLRIGLEFDAIGIEGLDDYKKITEHTGERRGFIDRPLSYYKNMFDTIGNNMEIILCYLNTEKAISLIQEEIDTINSFSDITEKRKQEIKDLEKKQEEIKELEAKHGKRILMAGSMFIACKDEYLNLYGGGFDEFMKWNAMYAIQWYAICHAKNKGYKLYNFYGIEGNFKKENNPMYGVYEFKKGFGGKVVELIGEFDLPINKAKYKFYKLAFSTYKKIKNTFNHFKNK